MSAFDDSEGSDYGDGLNGVIFADDPRTLSEIKRSRILLDRRYVFLCPTSLAKHFDVVPKQAKDTALLVFRCSREWLIRDPKEKKMRQLQSRVECGVPKKGGQTKAATPGRLPKATALSAAACHSEFSKEFIQWVIAKEKEDAIYWWKPEKDFTKLSKFLEDKIDPVTDEPYRPLLLDPAWWRVNFARTNARFCNNPTVVSANISERSNAGVDRRDVAIHVLQELIFQSNPTLEPITKWPYAPSMRFVPKAPSATRDFVGQYSSFKGYISLEGPSREEEQGRISHWPVVPRERQDDLYHSWQQDTLLARTLPNLSSSNSPRMPQGGLFGHGFGTGNSWRYAHVALDRQKSPPASAPGTSRSLPVPPASAPGSSRRSPAGSAPGSSRGARERERPSTSSANDTRTFSKSVTIRDDPVGL